MTDTRRIPIQGGFWLSAYEANDMPGSCIHTRYHLQPISGDSVSGHGPTLIYPTAIPITMNQAEIRFFVSTMNAVEDAIPEPDVKSVINNLNNLLEQDDKISKESREVILKAIDGLKIEVKDFDDKLLDIQLELYKLSPYPSYELQFSEAQAWRLEPYPWLGAPASPLLPFFSF